LSTNSESFNSILGYIQRAISFVPVIVLGSGASAPFGYAGMSELATYLLSNIVPDQADEAKWEEFVTAISNGMDLENALHRVMVSITDDFIIKRPWERLVAGGFELEFFSFPSEVHLWDGLICYEARRGILFCSDLIFRFGRTHGAVIEADWPSEVERIRQVPDAAKLAELKKNLLRLRPRFVATGHGPCLKIAE